MLAWEEGTAAPVPSLAAALVVLHAQAGRGCPAAQCGATSWGSIVLGIHAPKIYCSQQLRSGPWPALSLAAGVHDICHTHGAPPASGKGSLRNSMLVWPSPLALAGSPGAPEGGSIPGKPYTTSRAPKPSAKYGSRPLCAIARWLRICGGFVGPRAPLASGSPTAKKTHVAPSPLHLRCRQHLADPP
jgi:hypothetical protein